MSPEPYAVPAPTAWSPNRVVASSLGAGLVLLVLGALGGRPDVAVLGAAPVLGAAWDLRRRPRGVLGLEAPAATAAALAATEVGVLRAQVVLSAPVGTTAVRLRVSRPDGTRTDAVLRAARRRVVPAMIPSVRTGSQELFSLDVRALGPGGATASPVQQLPGARVLVLPRARRLVDASRVALPPRLRGHSGAHESRRPGDGGGLRDIHRFALGDSLRRVDWRVTARRSPDLTELYVRRTHALAEALVTLVVDSRDDVGPDPLTWNGDRTVRADLLTSLDLAREATATLAQAYLGMGDRVSLDDLGSRRRPVPAGSGRRQLDRIVHRVALLLPEGEPAARPRAPQVPAGALIYLMSTFLDPEAARTALLWRRAGHRVIGVDVLPALRLGRLGTNDRLALRIVTIERDDRLAELASGGVELMRWERAESSDGGGAARAQDPDRALALLARRSHQRPTGRARR